MIGERDNLYQLYLFDTTTNSYELILKHNNPFIYLNYIIDDNEKLKITANTDNGELIIINGKEQNVWKYDTITSGLYEMKVNDVIKITDNYFIHANIVTPNTFKYMNIGLWDISLRKFKYLQLNIPDNVSEILLYYSNSSSENKETKENKENREDDEWDWDDESDESDEDDIKWYNGSLLENKKVFIQIKNNIVYIIVILKNKLKTLMLFFKINIKNLNSDSDIDLYKCGIFDTPYDDFSVKSLDLISDDYILILTSKRLFQLNFLNPDIILEEGSLINISEEFTNTNSNRTKYYFLNSNQIISAVTSTYTTIRVLE